MGHSRVGTLPDTAPWRRVVALIAEEAEVAEVAATTAEAALEGLKKARYDPGLVHCVEMLARVVLSARGASFSEGLGECGIRAPEQPARLDIVTGFVEAIDDRLLETRGRTDIAEMAQLAGAESLGHLLRESMPSLFDEEPGDAETATYELSTKTGFCRLAHDFFSRFTHRFLTYHLGRELSLHVGVGERFDTPESHNAFLEELEVHCRETAAIMRDYAGDWYSKKKFESGITEEDVEDFTRRCLEKLSKELRRKEKKHVG